MTGVIDQAPANPEPVEQKPDNKEFNFRRLEQSRDEEMRKRVEAEKEREYLKRELEQIKTMLQPKEEDPLASIDPYDPKSVQAGISKTLEIERKKILKEAEEVVRQNLERTKKEDRVNSLRYEHSDYDQVMNEQNIAKLGDLQPELVESLLEVQDEYKRRKLAYQAIKKHIVAKPEPRASIKEKVEENKANPYFIPASHGNPPVKGIDFDMQSKDARKQAYEKLKAAQRRQIGGGSR